MSITNEAVQTVDLAILASFDEAQEQGEPDFVVELIDLYLEEAPRFFNSIRDGLANHDWLSAKRAAQGRNKLQARLALRQAVVGNDQIRGTPLPQRDIRDGRLCRAERNDVATPAAEQSAHSFQYKRIVFDHDDNGRHGGVDD